MEGALIVLIPVSVLIVAAVVGILWWAARHGQFDDMEGPAHAILMDDDKAAGPGAEHVAADRLASRNDTDPAQKSR